MFDSVSKHFYRARKRAFKILENRTVPPEKRHGINIKPLLLKFAKKQKFNEDFLDQFHLDLLDDKKKGEEFEELYKICAYRYDARFYFVLRYLGASNESAGICLLGFEIENNKILIK